METIVTLLLALLSMVTSFYQSRIDREIFELENENRKRHKRTHREH